jgi:hypothetical protein
VAVSNNILFKFKKQYASHLGSYGIKRIQLNISKLACIQITESNTYIAALHFENSPCNILMGEWRSCTVRSFIICTLSKYHYSDQVKANEEGRACGMHGRGEKIVQNFGGKA